MAKRWIRTIGFGCLFLVLCACGAGHVAGFRSPPSIQEVVSCLEKAGASAESLQAGSGGELLGAQAPDGDVTFVLNLEDPAVSARGAHELKKAMHEIGSGAVMSIRSANQGSTLVGVVGVKGIDGGVASEESSLLAKRCATQPQASAQTTA